MFLQNTYNYAIGYIQIQIEGFFVERFINLCMNRNIEVWNINKIYDGIITLKIRGYDWNKIEEIANLTKSKVTILKREGLPQITKRYSNRKIFAVVCLVAVICIYLYSLRIWHIDIEGDFSIPIEEINQLLMDENVYIGMLKKNLDFDEVKTNIYLKRNDILWIGFTIKGTRATVEVLERTLKDKKVLANEPCNIVSDKDGIIEKISVREGTKNAQKGDPVFKGDILVSGVMESENSDTRYVHANADIEIKTWYIGKISVPFEKTLVSKTGKVQKRYSIKLGKYIINLTNNSTKFEKYDTIADVKKLILFGKFLLPIELETTVLEEVVTDEVTYSKEQALEIAKREAKILADKNVPVGVEILDSVYKVFYTENEVQVRVTNECIEKVGIEEKL